MKSNPLFLQLLLVCFLCLNGIAQTKMVNVHFLYIPEENNTEPLDLLLGDEDAIEVELPTNCVSKNYQVPALSEWILGKATVEKGKFKFESYGKAKSISADNQLIVVSRKSEDEGEGLNLMIIDYNDSTYKGGMYYFINLTDTDIEGTISKSEFSLEPNKQVLIAPEPDKVTGSNKYCYTKFSYEKEDAMHPFISSTWRFNERARSLVLFYRDLTTKQFKLQTVRSYVE
jgi:hypothetical protein